ncbi:MAG: asparagine synthase (glutamine-hydrolyzing), partial [Pseudolabrys sp.]
YNYLALRDTLEASWTFRTDGDTEVVLAGLVTHGTSFLERMEGMWAIALWDDRERELLLTRDRLGKKPLYFQSARQGFACASELPALRRLGLGHFHEDLDSTADYLRYGFFMPGTTAYRDVREVLPGHLLRWRPDGETYQRAYWTLPIEPSSCTRNDAKDRLRDLLEHAVAKRMVADVEVGAFLSGGIDSSLIVAIMANRLGIRPKTFSMGFSDPTFDERQYARLMSATCRTEHFEECMSVWDRDLLERLLTDHVGQPFYDVSLLPTAMVSELAARHVKVALSGDGGDELFSGYQRYQARALLRWYSRLPAPLRKAGEGLVHKLPEPTAHHSRSLLKKAQLFVAAAEREGATATYVAPLLYSEQEFANLAPELMGRGHTPPNLPQETRLDDIKQMMVADALVYLPQDVLLKVDRASMAYSLEVRAPFLDHHLVEFAFSLPRRFHRHGYAGKRLLRSGMSDLLPRQLWGRRKQGFGVPVHQWLAGEMGRELEQLAAQSDSPVANQPVMDLLAAHRTGRRDNSARLWNLYVYYLFHAHGLT